MSNRREFLKVGATHLAAMSVGLRTLQSENRAEFVCPPCKPCTMDDRIFTAPGKCPGCGMTLIPRATALAAADLKRTGSGAFTVPGGTGNEQKTITVHYHRPERFTAQSPILIVLPGTGRNGAEYLDAWKQTSNETGVFVAGLAYPEADYDFAAYHLGGVVKNLRFPPIPRNADGSEASVVRLRDEDIRFEYNPRQEQWLFNDFDRIFDLIVARTGSAVTTYDLFGHSAGAQILHRHVLFHPTSKANRIVAANAGFYTLPDFGTPQILGLKGTAVTRESIARSLSARLTLLLGELDDSGEEGGINLHTPSIDKQGIGRLARGLYFYSSGAMLARKMEVPFGWKVRTVPRVGHEFRKMSEAAAAMLYRDRVSR